MCSNPSIPTTTKYGKNFQKQGKDANPEIQAIQ
jgi:hypothetical protein